MSVIFVNGLGSQRCIYASVEEIKDRLWCIFQYPSDVDILRIVEREFGPCRCWKSFKTSMDRRDFLKAAELRER